MIKSSIEKLADPIGFDISNSDDVVQAALLNGMGRGFATYNDQQMDMQMCYIADKLTPQAKKFIKALHQFVKDEN